MTSVDASAYKNELGIRNKIYRSLWNIVYWVLFRPSPIVFFFWRRFLLRCFGAKLEKGAVVYPSCKIWAPYNLKMGRYSCLAGNVDCYDVGRVTIGSNVTVSQYCFLCTASHDISDPLMGLIVKPLTIMDSAWIAAGAYVAPGILIAEGSVVAARSVVIRSTESWSIVGGNPAIVIGNRKLSDSKR